MNPASMNRFLAAVAIAALLGACSPEQAEQPASPPAPAEASTPAVPAAPPTASNECALTEASMTIEHVRLSSADGACTVLIPAPVAAAEYPVAASASQTAASVELRGPDGTLYATAGTVTLSGISPRLVGTISADDQSPPATGQISGTFDIAAP